VAENKIFISDKLVCESQTSLSKLLFFEVAVPAYLNRDSTGFVTQG
jgi:hypothetical protein